MAISRSPFRPLTKQFLARSPVACAKGLVGGALIWGGKQGLIVETEAYQAVGDEACHTASRPSARNYIEKHEAGAAYVYMNYGIHWLLNILVKGGPVAGFVLIRAVEPQRGLSRMRALRKRELVTELCSGPGKLTQAFGITGDDHGTSLLEGSHRLMLPGSFAAVEVACCPRVGISKAKQLPWRFVLRGNPSVSCPQPW